MKDTIQQLERQYHTARQMRSQAKRELDEASLQREAAVEAQRVAQTIAQGIQQRVHDRMAAVVSRCLEAVFDDPYEFRITFERKRGRTEARLVFVRDGKEIDPKSAAGGGAVDVAAFALRLAALELSRPRPRRLLVLDEPFRFLHSRVYRERARALMETLAEEMGFQIVMATGMNELRTGTVVEIE